MVVGRNDVFQIVDFLTAQVINKNCALISFCSGDFGLRFWQLLRKNKKAKLEIVKGKC